MTRPLARYIPLEPGSDTRPAVVAALVSLRLVEPPRVRFVKLPRLSRQERATEIRRRLREAAAHATRDEVLEAIGTEEDKDAPWWASAEARVARDLIGDLQQTEIARMWGICRERVRQLEVRALDRFRRRMTIERTVSDWREHMAEAEQRGEIVYEAGVPISQMRLIPTAAKARVYRGHARKGRAA